MLKYLLAKFAPVSGKKSEKNVSFFPQFGFESIFIMLFNISRKSKYIYITEKYNIECLLSLYNTFVNSAI